MVGEHIWSLLFSKMGGGKKMSFTYLFYKHIMFRQSCGKCHFANTKRPSDITIADFWGWEKTAPEFNKDDKGVSLVLVNTEKGKLLFDKVKDRMNVFPARLEDCLQTHLRKPSDIHPLRIQFEEDYKRKGFEYVYLKYSIPSRYRRYRFIWKMRIKRICNLLKNAIRKNEDRNIDLCKES